MNNDILEIKLKKVIILPWDEYELQKDKLESQGYSVMPGSFPINTKPNIIWSKLKFKHKLTHR